MGSGPRADIFQTRWFRLQENTGIVGFLGQPITVTKGVN